MSRFLPILLICLIAFSSCNDHLKIEEDNNPQGYADSQVAGIWKITAVSSNAPYDWDGNGSAETDVYGTWSACKKDNLFKFYGDKTGVYQTDCNNSYNGAWQIFNAQQLEYTPDGLSTVIEKITSMSSNEFKTSRSEFIPNGPTLIVTKTWTRQ